MDRPLGGTALSGDPSSGAGKAGFVPLVGGGPGLRALLSILFVSVAGVIVVAHAEAVVRSALTVVGLRAGGEEIAAAFRIVLPLAIGAIALVSALLFGHRIRIGRDDPLTSVAALPSGVAVMTLVLVPVGLAGGIGEGGAGGASVQLLLVGTPVILFAAFSEELLLRGALQPVLARAWGLWPALLLSAACFMLIHLVGGWLSAVSLANIFLASIWFGLLAARSGGLLAPTLAHFGYNWSEELLFGASPNPGVGPYGALFNLDLIGSPRLGGSPEGMNSSPILTGTLLLVIVILLADMRRRRRRTGGEAGRP